MTAMIIIYNVAIARAVLATAAAAVITTAQTSAAQLTTAPLLQFYLKPQ
jgi:hypothetical protein